MKFSMTFKLSCGLHPFSALNVFHVALLGFTLKKTPEFFQLSRCIFNTQVCVSVQKQAHRELSACFFGESH